VSSLLLLLLLELPFRGFKLPFKPSTQINNIYIAYN